MKHANLPKDVREKLAKVYALAEHGGTEGEKAAARNLLDKLLKKYNIEDADFGNLNKEIYWLRYRTKLEHDLILLLIEKLFPFPVKFFQKLDFRKVAMRVIGCLLDYPDYIMLDSAYEYFRAHMKRQYKLHCEPMYLKMKHRGKAKAAEYTKAAFFGTYVTRSGLMPPPDEEKREALRRELLDNAPTTKEAAELNAQKLKAHLAASRIEGGNFTTQVAGSEAKPVTLLEG